jgi:hypothetical protein
MPTYTLIASNTVGAGGAASVTFNSIPQTGYTDLVLKASVRTNRATFAGDSIFVKLNNSTSSFSNRILQGYGPGTQSTTTTNPVENYASADTNVATANTFSNVEYYIPNYASANFKSVSSDGVVENNSSSDFNLGITASLWSSTAAITSMTIVPGYGTTLQQYSTFTLYGISNA